MWSLTYCSVIHTLVLSFPCGQLKDKIVTIHYCSEHPTFHRMTRISMRLKLFQDYVWTDNVFFWRLLHHLLKRRIFLSSLTFLFTTYCSIMIKNMLKRREESWWKPQCGLKAPIFYLFSSSSSVYSSDVYG